MLDLPTTQDGIHKETQDLHLAAMMASWVGVRSNFQHILFKGWIPFLERNKSFKWLKIGGSTSSTKNFNGIKVL